MYLPKSREFITLQYTCPITLLPLLSPDAPIRNRGFTFDPHLSFSNHISNLSRSCFMHILDLRRIRPMLNFKTASTIASSIVHPNLDYWSSLFLNLDSTQIQLCSSTQIQLCSLSKTHLHRLLPERP